MRAAARYLLAALLGTVLGIVTAVVILVFGAGVFWLWIFGDDPWPRTAEIALSVAAYGTALVVFGATVWSVAHRRTVGAERAEVTMPGDMVRWLPFPYPGNRFPDQLGAVVQRTVLEGREPARVVIHDRDGHWAIGDGVNDPNEPGACIATHVNHVVRDDPSLEELAKMAPGQRADRAGRRDPWMIQSHSYDDAER